MIFSNTRIKAKLTKIILFLFVALYIGMIPTTAFALTGAQIKVFRDGIPYFNTESSTAACSASETSLVGSDNEQKTWNYFKSKGLDNIHTAAVMGNIHQESTFNPQIMEIGGNSKDPRDAGSKGWGLVQWTPGSRVIGIAEDLHITGPIYELSTQLDIVWGEMTGTAPTGLHNILAGFKRTTTLTDATEYFRAKFESGTAGNRQQYAQDALQKYGSGEASGSTTINTDTGACGASSALSPDCQTAQGSAKILCAAKAYDRVSYEESIRAGHQGGAEWHASCPEVDPSCVLDCSGLVNIAVYDVFNVDLRENTYSEASDTTHWKHINIDNLQPGDLVQPNPRHVEIVDHIVGDTIYTFGAHSPNRPQPKQVGPAQYSKSDISLSLHWIGS